MNRSLPLSAVPPRSSDKEAGALGGTESGAPVVIRNCWPALDGLLLAIALGLGLWWVIIRVALWVLA